MAVVEVLGLHKSYRRGRTSSVALDGLDLEVPEGGVHGFLGPNAAGKTTTLRVLLGLTRADSGEVRVLGRRVPQELSTVVGGVGALVESPRLFPQWGGRFNLQILARYAGVGADRVEECLDLTGMTSDGDVPFSHCSLGMKQRLGIAAALLKRPRLLVLDEPGNGLDPAGIREIRELVRAVGGSGSTTVLISSHQLHEVQQICDRVSVVARGRLAAQGPVASLLTATDAPAEILVRVRGSLDRTQVLLVGVGIDSTLTPDGLLIRGVADPAMVSELLAQHGEYVSALIPQESSLEAAFLAWTSDPDQVGVES